MQELGTSACSRIKGEATGCIRAHVRRRRDRLLGPTIVVCQAGERLPGLTLALVSDSGPWTPATVLQPYPAPAEAIHTIVEVYNRTRWPARVQTSCTP